MARAAEIDSCPLTPELQKQIRRLKGKLREPAGALQYESMHGNFELPSSLAWFHAVEWPADAKFEAKKPKLDPRLLEMQWMSVTESYGAQFAERPFVSVLFDSGQFFYFTALDRDDPDPLVFHVDHEGQGSGQASATPLSAILAKYVARMPESPKSQLTIPDPKLKELALSARLRSRTASSCAESEMVDPSRERSTFPVNRSRSSTNSAESCRHAGCTTDGK